jgi:hypoxanthine phosphoribosyltransferase
MKYQEIRLKELPAITKNLFTQIENDGFLPDSIISIDRGGRLLGFQLSEVLKVPQYFVSAHRRVPLVKKLAKKFLPLIPQTLRKYLREKELQVNNRLEPRFVDSSMVPLGIGGNILCVDDSLDTGATLKEAIENISLSHHGIEQIKIAVINTTNRTRIIEPDYVVYTDTILCFPWSDDSIEKKEFQKIFSAIPKRF